MTTDADIEYTALTCSLDIAAAELRTGVANDIADLASVVQHAADYIRGHCWPDLSAAEHRLAEAFRDYPDGRLRAGAWGVPVYWNSDVAGEAIVFAATYELARRERERSQHETQAKARSTDG